MARFVSKELPDDLYQRLDGRNLGAQAEKAILICTVGSDGWPHPAMLSHFEVVARDRHNIRLATYSSSTTTGNMRRNGKATLSIIDRGAVYYIKGTVRELQAELECAPGNCKLNLQIDAVLSDQSDQQLEAGAFVSGGVTFQNPNMTVEMPRARRLLQALME